VLDDAYQFYKASFTKIQPYSINSPLFIKLIDNEGKQIGGMITDSVGTFINQGFEEYTLEKDKNMFASTILLMNACEQYMEYQNNGPSNTGVDQK
jgi:hypothetical protein